MAKTEEKIKFLKLLQDGEPFKSAMQMVGISAMTAYKWKAEKYGSPRANKEPKAPKEPKVRKRDQIKWKAAELIGKVKGGISPRQAAAEIGVSYSTAIAYLRKAGVKWERTKPQRKNIKVYRPSEPIAGAADTRSLERYCTMITSMEIKGLVAAVLVGEDFELAKHAKLACLDILRQRQDAESA